ncbi:hypothetical protein TREES_T100019556 [Tupaia chinensis]|uniref:Uncharacterized protein n=1 Tax=Tupaia chinensis TaxID=246437 RepID=L9K694_TUPCH|nr:hypothetical protein TREES_T100019556 [Tupaia chinensis]
MKSFMCLSRSLPSTARVATSAATRGRIGDRDSRVCAHADAPTCTQMDALRGPVADGRTDCVLTQIFYVIKVNLETKANVRLSKGSQPGYWPAAGTPRCTIRPQGLPAGSLR